MPKKPIPELKTLFLDTGVIIDLLKVDFTNVHPDVVNRISITRRFFNAIDSFSKNAIYQTCAINLAEIFHFDGGNENLMKAIVSVTGGKQFEVIAFDETAAFFHNQNFEKIAGNATIQELKKEVNYAKGNGFANIQDRIRKDILIASTAKQYNCDIILTNDSGFFELCNRLDVSCYCFTEYENDFLMSSNGEKIYNWA